MNHRAHPPHAADMAGDVLEQAIAWAVQLQSGQHDDRVHGACAAWRSAHPSHEQAWQQVQAVEQRFSAIPAGAGSLAHQALDAAQAGQAPRTPPAKGTRRRAVQLLGLAVLAGTGGLLALRQWPWRQETHYASRAGQRQDLTLADGTRLRLNTRTAVDVVFTPLQRLLVLREGDIFMDTGDDISAPGGKRPFWVHTPSARLQAIGTAFAVRREPPAGGTAADATQLHVRQGVVAIHRDGQAPVLVQAGETYRITEGSGTTAIARVWQPESDPTAWLEGVLVAKQMRLDTFAAALSRHYGTPVACEPAAAALRVSGVFQLDHPDAMPRALDALAGTLPVRIGTTAKGHPLIALR